MGRKSGMCGCVHACLCLSVFMGKNDGKSTIITDYMCEHGGIKCIHMSWHCESECDIYDAIVL